VVAERLRRAVADRKFSFGGKDIPVTISLGIVAIPESGITDHNSFLAAADRALYEAKRSGRNRVCVHGSEQTPPEPRKRDDKSGPNRAATPGSGPNRTGQDPNRVTQERSAKAGEGDDPRGE
jgi:hypothetical protein